MGFENSLDSGVKAHNVSVRMNSNTTRPSRPIGSRKMVIRQSQLQCYNVIIVEIDARISKTYPQLDLVSH